MQGKSTSFRIASHFLTDIEYSHRVPTSIFVEMFLWELTTESEYEFFQSVETSRISNMPKLKNFLYYKAKIMIEIKLNICSFKNDWTE